MIDENIEIHQRSTWTTREQFQTHALLRRVHQLLLHVAPPRRAEVTTWIHRSVTPPRRWHPPWPRLVMQRRRPDNAFQTPAKDHHQLRAQRTNQRQPRKIRLDRLSFTCEIP